jgi:hypothetical protein
MRGFLASLICAIAIGAVGVYLIVSWFGSLELPR